MTDYVMVVTYDGIDNMHRSAFYGGNVNQFRYAALGTSTSVPTQDAHALGAELVAGVNGYQRVEITNTFNPDDVRNTVKHEVEFSASNINASTDVTEFGICDTASGAAIFWCVCQIPTTTKVGTKALKITAVTSGV